MKKRTKNKVKFVMDTDWIFDGVIDSEQKQYVLLSYFQKLNKNLEDIKIYPMFTEISLHLANIQTLINQDKIIYSDKKLTSFDDEFLLSDLKAKDIPVLADDEVVEYRKVLQYSLPKFQEYFQIVKSIWVVVFEATQVAVKKNKNYLNSNTGFFYFCDGTNNFVWKYTTRKVRGFENTTKTNIKLIYNEPISDLTIIEIISNFVTSETKSKGKKFPILEVSCDNIFPFEETMIPIFKRKVMSYISQSVKNEKKPKTPKLLTNGV